jgi:hypothetical protein
LRHISAVRGLSLVDRRRQYRRGRVDRWVVDAVVPPIRGALAGGSCALPDRYRGLRLLRHLWVTFFGQPHELSSPRSSVDEGASRCRILAQSVSLRGLRLCPELGVKATCRLNARTSEFDPKRTSSGMSGPFHMANKPVRCFSHTWRGS